MHKRGTHDVGGLPAGPIPRTDHVEEDWEIRLNSMMNLLRAPHIDKITIDEVRPLGNKQHLVLVSCRGQSFLVGVSADRIVPISTLPPASGSE